MDEKLSSTAVIKIDTAAAREAQYDLPQSYGKTESFLLPKDPNWMFLFWEIINETYEIIKDQKGQNVFDNARTIIRVYDITNKDFDGTNANSYFDVPVVLDARSWYLQVRSGRTYICDIGFITPSGEFIILTRSNKTTVPTGEVSNVIDEKWMMVEGDYEKILKMSGAEMFGTGASEKLQHILAQRWRAFEIGRENNPSSHITSWMSSHTFAQPQTQTDEDIWLKAACEIIIYGQASKNADVYIKGEKITVDEDGSFSFRFPLSEGQVVDMPIKAQHKTKGEKQRFITIKAKREEA